MLAVSVHTIVHVRWTKIDGSYLSLMLVKSLGTVASLSKLL